MAAVMVTGTVATLTACNNDPVTKEPQVTGIQVTKAPDKVNYVLGETFNPAGMEVSKVYDNDETEAIPSTEYTYTPNTALALNNKEVTIKWTEYTCKQKISVTNNVKTVEVTHAPDKTSYITGELFDPTGMKIQATLENGDKEPEKEVNSDDVEYNTGKLVAKDSKFEMTYGGCTFYYDMVVKCGAFMEAEAGLPITAGASVGTAPNKVAVEADINNLPGKTGDGVPFCRGIDKGVVGKTPNGDDYTITESRVNIREYIFDPADTEYKYEDFCATGGGNVASLAPTNNILQFDRNGTGSVLYALTADKAGKVNLTLRMTLTDPDNSSVAPQTKVNEVLEFTVNGKKVTVADSVVIPAVDLSAKKSYVPGTTLSTLDHITGTFTGNDKIRTNFCWQNVTVPLDMVEGANSIIVKSLVNTKKDLRIDSLSFDGDADKVSLFNESAFAPEIMSAKLKVENEKVYMGLIVDPKAVSYDDATVQTILNLTTVKGTSCSSYDGNYNENGVGDKNDPWSSGTDNGGLGYTTKSPLHVAGKAGDWKNVINERGVTVEKITSGDYKDLYYVWFEVTTPDDTKTGYTTPDTNRNVGAFYFSGFTYGKDYAKISPPKDILKTGDSTYVSNGDYCYQVYCDARDKNAGFYAGNECYIMLIVQNGTFDADKATTTLPLRNLLMRRYVSHFEDNDQELIDLRKDKPAEPTT